VAPKWEQGRARFPQMTAAATSARQSLEKSKALLVRPANKGRVQRETVPSG
jgi:hypothetical protein